MDNVDASFVDVLRVTSGHPPGKTHQIKGTVTSDGDPVKRAVVVCRTDNLQRVAIRLSDSDGHYALTGMAPGDGPFLVLALDWPGKKGRGQNAVVSDRIMPSPMED